MFDIAAASVDTVYWAALHSFNPEQKGGGGGIYNHARSTHENS